MSKYTLQKAQDEALKLFDSKDSDIRSYAYGALIMLNVVIEQLHLKEIKEVEFP